MLNNSILIALLDIRPNLFINCAKKLKIIIVVKIQHITTKLDNSTVFRLCLYKKMYFCVVKYLTIKQTKRIKNEKYN
jgi:hypothetical protein